MSRWNMYGILTAELSTYGIAWVSTEQVVEIYCQLICFELAGPAASGHDY
jgi:hypothetical protein